MAKYIKVLVFLLGIAGLVSSFSFLGSSDHIEKAELNATQFFEEFKAATMTLTEKSQAYQLKKTKLDTVQQMVAATRLAYKKIEFLLEYYYPSFVEEHVNGAPLYHAEKYSTQSLVKPPEGLQVLDELVYSDEAEEQAAEIAILARTLANKSLELEIGFQQNVYELGAVIEAMRMELIRVFSMGLAGFDTPGSANAIPEARTAMASMQHILQQQKALKTSSHFAKAEQLFEEAVAYLRKHTDFDTFDRLAFLKAFINPLYKELALLQSDLGLTTEPLHPSGRNEQAMNIFDADFLDPYFYAELKAEEDGDALRQIGKALFYDTRLSGNLQMSCASCHHPDKAFTDGLQKSQSNIMGKTVMRNSPTLLNAVYADRYFYDMRAFTLEQQAEHVIFNENEFDTAYEELLQKLNEDDAYPTQFKAVFGESQITRKMLSKALASYVLSLQSFNSEFDQYVRGEQEAISEEVRLGFNLFMGKAACGTCHFAPTFAGLMPPYFSKNESEILGVLKTPHALRKKLDEDEGRMVNGLHYENVWIYEKSFKTPTVRNIEKTAPYFHNGAYVNLDLVVDFYNHGGGAGLGLEVNNQTLAPDHLNLTEVEQSALVAFMKSLTDTDY